VNKPFPANKMRQDTINEQVRPGNRCRIFLVLTIDRHPGSIGADSPIYGSRQSKSSFVSRLFLLPAQIKGANRDTSAEVKAIKS
jgi:hypothetical protein